MKTNECCYSCVVMVCQIIIEPRHTAVIGIVDSIEHNLLNYIADFSEMTKRVVVSRLINESTSVSLLSCFEKTYRSNYHTP